AGPDTDITLPSGRPEKCFWMNAAPILFWHGIVAHGSSIEFAVCWYPPLLLTLFHFNIKASLPPATNLISPANNLSCVFGEWGFLRLRLYRKMLSPSSWKSSTSLTG